MTHGNGNSTPTAHTRIESLLRKALAVAHFAAAATVTPQASWTQPAWFVDPSNVTGLASDQNDGKTALRPVRTWNGGVVRKLDTYAPRLRQTTTITFLSSQPDFTDPVIFTPYLENGASAIIAGALPAGTAGVLGAVTAKNRATNTLLSTVSVPGAGTVGQFIVNATRADSTAFIYKVAGGPTVTLSQPFNIPPIPLTGAVAPMNNAWATGDSVTTYTLPLVNIVQLQPLVEDRNATFNNELFVQRITIGAPTGPGGLEPIIAGPNVTFIECDIQRMLVFCSTMALSGYGNYPINCALRGGLFGGPNANLGGATQVLTTVNGGFVLTLFSITNARLDGDCIVGASGAANDCAIGAVALDTGVVLTLYGSTAFKSATAYYLTAVLYGGGTVDASGASTLRYNAGAGAAVAAFPLTPRIQIDGGTTAHSVVSGAPDVLNGGIATTAANLDAAAGAAGFGGNAFNLGGASIANLPV